MSRHEKMNLEAMGAFDIRIHRNTWHVLYGEYADLKSKLEIATEALEVIELLDANAITNVGYSQELAREALKKIGVES